MQVTTAYAGSFTVDAFADPNIILYISGALVFFAFTLGFYILRGEGKGKINSKE